MVANNIEYSMKAQGAVLQQYTESRARCSFIMGPLGCLRGSTQVVTSEGLVRIDSIIAGTQVLSWNEKTGQYCFSVSGNAYPKGEDYLYQISTQQGEFGAASHHRVLCDDGKYQHVESLVVGQRIAYTDLNLPESEQERPEYPLCGQRSMRTVSGYQDGYEGSAHQCDQPLHLVQDSAQEFAPSLAGVDGLFRSSDPSLQQREDDQEELLQEHIHQRLCAFLKQRMGYFSQAVKQHVDLAFAVVSPPLSQYVLQCSAPNQVVEPSVYKSNPHHISDEVDHGLTEVCLPLHSYSISNKTIDSITRLDVKEVYWDIHVPETNNYVTVDGTVHHNSGKTVETILKIFDLMCEQAPVTRKDHKNNNVRLSRFVAVRNTYSELFSTTIKDWLEMHGDLGVFKQGSKQPPTQILDFDLDDGTRVLSEIIFIAFDRPDHIKKARGLQLTGVWLNEVKELPKSVIDMLDLRHGRYPSKKEGVTCTWHGMVGDTNAPDEDHWYHTAAEEQDNQEWEFFRQPGGVYKDGEDWIVNPHAENISNLPEGYYRRGLANKSDDWIKVNLANEYGYVSDGKPVHPRYVDSVHCQNINFTPDKNFPIVLGFDFGRTPACALLQRLPAFSRWVMFDEFLCDDMSAITFAPELKRYLDTNYNGFSFRGWGDPSGNNRGQGTDDTPFQIVRTAGIPCFPTETNNPTLRRAALEIPMKEMCMDGKPRFIILPKASMARKGLQGGFCYRRIMVSGEKYTDEPDKNEYSHIVEALEYGLQGEGEGRVAVISGYEAAQTVQAEGFNVFQ